MSQSLILFVLGAALMALLSQVWSRKFSFRAQMPEQYASDSPAFDITRTLNGPMDAEGMIFDFRGRMTSRFTARFNASWQGANGQMTEAFHYSTGRSQNREWTMHVSNDGTFRATAPDIIGEAEGVQSGATVRMTYRIKLPQEAGGHVLDVTDWMYLVENGTVLNRSEFRKFGIKVAELIATFRQAAA
jgi:hypothetical protein